MTSNVNAILQRLGISKEIYYELLSDFVGLAQEKYLQLEKAAEQNLLEEIKKIAHSIKGSAANLGVELIAETAKKIETDAATGECSERVKENISVLGRQIILCKNEKQ